MKPAKIRNSYQEPRAYFPSQILAEKAARHINDNLGHLVCWFKMRSNDPHYWEIGCDKEDGITLPVFLKALGHYNTLAY